MKNPFQSGETFMEKMGKTRTNTQDKNNPHHKPSFTKTKSMGPENTFTSLRTDPLAKLKPTLDHNSRNTSPAFNPHPHLKQKPYNTDLPSDKSIPYDYQRTNDVFSQERSMYENRNEERDISLNLPLSPIRSMPMEDNSVLPMSDSLLMQCLAKADTRDELIKLLGATCEMGNLEDPAATDLSNNYNNEPRSTRPATNYQQHVYQEMKNVPVRTQGNENDRFDFDEFKRDEEEENQDLQSRQWTMPELPKVMKYEPPDTFERGSPSPQIQTLPRFSNQIRLNFEINLLEKINKQMLPLYQKDNIRVFLTQTDKITMRRVLLSE